MRTHDNSTWWWAWGRTHNMIATIDRGRSIIDVEDQSLAGTALCAASLAAAHQVYDPGTHQILLGVDATHYQGDLNWPSLWRCGVDCAVLKVSEGVVAKTAPMYLRWYREHAQQAADAGMRMAVYHFGRPDISGTRSRGIAEADHCAQHVISVHDIDGCSRMRLWGVGGGAWVDVWLDLEKSAGDKRSPHDCAPWVGGWLDRMAEHGLAVGIYSSRRWVDRHVSCKETLDRMYRVPWWVARYGKNPDPWPWEIPLGYPPAPKLPSGVDWSGWQISSRGRFPGVPLGKRIDVNVFRIVV